MSEKLRRSKWYILILVLLIILLITGTMTYTNFLQREKNEFAGINYNGVRLHDDYFHVSNAEDNNKDIYVENHGDVPLLVRVKLKEFFTLGETVMAGTTAGAVATDPGLATNWITHDHYNPNSNINQYWTWTQGTALSPSAAKYYLPTENHDPASSAADNVAERATYYGIAGAESTFNPAGQADYITGSNFQTFYSKVPDATSPGNFIYTQATSAPAAYVMKMSDWTAQGRPAGDFWVADTDGWYYWARYLPPNSATGLLLDKVTRNLAMPDEYYYGIKANLEAVTFGEVDKFTTQGDGAPTANAKDLMAIISGNVLGKISRPASESNNYTIEWTTASVTLDGTAFQFDSLVSTALQSQSIKGLGGTGATAVPVTGVAWTLVSQPSGANAAIASTTGAVTNMTVLGTYVFRCSSQIEPDKYYERRVVRK